MSRKDIKDLVKWAKDNGWEVARTKRHIKFIPPHSRLAIVHCSSTPGDYRTILNTRALMRKEMRESDAAHAIKDKSSLT